jgi:hypothetical protein
MRVLALALFGVLCAVVWTPALLFSTGNPSVLPNPIHQVRAPTSRLHRERFEGKGVSTSCVSPPGPLSISYDHVGCLKARAFQPAPERAHHSPIAAN